MNRLAEQLSALRLIPVIKIGNVSDAAPLMAALRQGGLPAAEITLRTPAGLDAIRAAKAACPDMLIGAGTVYNAQAADAAVAAGADFLVSPGFEPSLAAHCAAKGYDYLPGVCTPSEIMQAMALGYDTLKFFPAEASGGKAALAAIAAAFGGVRFVPTGGINPQNAAGYLSMPCVIACGGSWMVPSDMLAAGDFSGIERLTAEAVAATR